MAPGAAGVGPQLAPLLHQRRQRLDHLGRDAGDAAREARVVRPSFVARAPVPPAWKIVSENERPSELVPRQTLSQIGSAPPAISRRAATCASAPKMAPGQEVADQVPRRDRRRLGGS